MEKASFQNQRLQKAVSGPDQFLLFPDTGRPRRNWHQLFTVQFYQLLIFQQAISTTVGSIYNKLLGQKCKFIQTVNFMEGNSAYVHPQPGSAG